jgi:zinc and cadmium transporter
MLIVLYCLAIVVFSLAGGMLPLSKRVTHLTLQVYLSLSAGAMLGAAFFHMLPESAELAGRNFGLWTICGIVGLYMIERFLSPHSHDTSVDNPHPHDHEHEAEGHEDHEDHEHDAASHAAPAVAGWSAVIGLSIHTLLGGIALGSAVLAGVKGLGFAVFLATVLHKPADALTISALLVKGRTKRSRVFAVQCFFAMLIPAGVALYYFGQTLIAGNLETPFQGAVLAFSAGTFICIALSDLLPEVQFHRHDRGRLFAAVIAGAAIMWATSFFEPEHLRDDAHSATEVQGLQGAVLPVSKT